MVLAKCSGKFSLLCQCRRDCIKPLVGDGLIFLMWQLKETPRSPHWLWPGFIWNGFNWSTLHLTPPPTHAHTRTHTHTRIHTHMHTHTHTHCLLLLSSFLCFDCLYLFTSVRRPPPPPLTLLWLPSPSPLTLDEICMQNSALGYSTGWKTLHTR